MQTVCKLKKVKSSQTSLLYNCQKISFSKLYTKPVYSTSIHKNSVLYKCTQKQFTVQVYTELVYWLIMNGMYRDRTLQRYKCHKISFSTTVHKTSLLYNTSAHKTSLVNWFRVPLYSNWFCVHFKQPNLGNIQFWDNQTDNQTDTDICTSRAASLQLKTSCLDTKNLKLDNFFRSYGYDTEFPLKINNLVRSWIQNHHLSSIDLEFWQYFSVSVCKLGQ